MEIVQVNNPELIQEFMTQPELYDRLSEDYAGPAESWGPNLALSIWLMVYELVDGNPDVWGMVAFAPETKLVYRFHPAISPNHWGDKRNKEVGKLAVQWLWDHTDAQKIVAKAPAIYPDALKWAQRVGFKREGIQKQSFLKHGELHDQYHVGMNRETE